MTKRIENLQTEEYDPRKNRARVRIGKTIALFTIAGLLLAFAIWMKPRPEASILIATYSEQASLAAHCDHGIVCVNGAWECQSTPPCGVHGRWPMAEIPQNLIDDDCDGFVDEGLPERQESSQVIPSHPMAEQIPQPEICNSYDDDCDDYGAIVWPARPIPIIFFVDNSGSLFADRTRDGGTDRSGGTGCDDNGCPE